ncbi:putative membrane protein YphA (DoxX/SURF4 family) [Microvirga flocculans]|uniref:Putative membrane protein YphA (DoxX/SURF4 family) n=1 Tax=Microvirga flocculans TaxID=217168 RepID=A0A7W6IEI5_9HYPH|nr:DoxX family protein [Microvirga flocculans]MBB4039430.1 putative membrane protein YphA (DoxX/SURF4 family) [Microvirga flocculans]
MGEARGAGVNGILLLNRLLLAGCFLPAALGRVTNISGFAAALTLKGVPYGDVVATLIVVAEVFGPLALILGLAPRLSASALIVALVVATGTLHRFWEYGGLTRQAEQAVFLSHLGVLAGLLFYALMGPGAWSWQAWWRGLNGQAKPAKGRKRQPSRPRTPKPRPAPVRQAVEEDDLADAA